MHLLVLVGSNRADSYNARLADIATREVPAGTEVSTFDLSRLPFYSEDLDADDALGQDVADFRAAVAAADAILLASPAYNGTLSALAKNAIDVASRPREAASIAGKPVLVITATFGAPAAEHVVAHAHLALTIAGAKPLERSFAVNPHFSSFEESGLVDKDAERELQAAVADLLQPAAVSA